MLEVNFEKELYGFTLKASFAANVGEYSKDTEILALMGGSGSGKSMTLKCIAGIDKPDKGYIVFNGRTLFDSEKRINLSPQKREIGYLFQQYALFPNMTVKQNVITGMHNQHMTKSEAIKTADEILQKMQLADVALQKPEFLSGGQKQRCALARILVNKPKLLLLDEPFSSLDFELRNEMEALLINNLKEHGHGAIFVSHSEEEVLRICDSVCSVNRGVFSEKSKLKNNV